MASPDTEPIRVFRHPATIATFSFLLAFAGSSIHLLEPLRPFHWGAGLIVVLFAINPEWRRTLAQTRSRMVVAVGGGLILASSLWMVDSGRYLNYALFFTIGALYMVLAETMVRRGIAFERWFVPLAIYWFVTALFPIFDTWTNSTLFRDSLPITGGVWYNINDMATALVFACVIWMLSRRRLPWFLFAAAWVYALGLNRRADVLALAILGLGYLLMGLKNVIPRLRFVLAWVAASAAGMALHGGTFYIGALPSLVQEPPFHQCTNVPADAVPLGMIAAQCVRPPPGVGSADWPPPVPHAPPLPATPTPAPSAAAVPGVPAGPAAAAPVAPIIPSPPATGATASAESMAAPPMPPAATPTTTDVVAHGGDVSSAIRSKILYEMYETAQHMSWWKWFTGLGVGQLNVTWPLDNRAWASPHFFWLEMFFFFGLPWIFFIGWLLWRADRFGRLALIVVCAAGIAPSSLVYFQPFWFLLGVVLATLPKRPDDLDNHA
ncbi:hypothetical protein LP085_06560 [Achromobacter sp. MY14]|uniref:hypothetical protein n=1 Tax=Achromobacter TaxID=222 RepID=UPI000F8F87E7|nr:MULTISPECIES: hypothetical protein [Achromobacter]AZS82257.1 hypothetical protein ELS24_29785 [Achromobacter spanius]MCD0496503.1 hypothetical protein [Achromobacter sp. MY14]